MGGSVHVRTGGTSLSRLSSLRVADCSCVHVQLDVLLHADVGGLSVGLSSLCCRSLTEAAGSVGRCNPRH